MVVFNNIDWFQSDIELESQPNEPIIIGKYCADRICIKDKSEKKAIIDEDPNNKVKTFT